MLPDLALFIFALTTLWFGAGLIVTSLDKISKQLEISAFAASFFLLGFLTSLPELSVGINAIIDKKPEIFVGNLIGGSLIIFILIIPLLAILGNGVTLSHQLSIRKLIFSLYLVGLPALLIIDKNLSLIEGFLLIFLYLVLFYTLEKRKGIIDHFRDKFTTDRRHNISLLGKILIGAFVVFYYSGLLVDQTIVFSADLGISPFLLSLLGLSIGTNLPEISIALRSITSGNKEIALGDYIGSASTNSVILGVLTIVNGTSVSFNNHFLITFSFMLVGLSLFFYFTRSKNDISRKEGLILLILYLTFVVMEVV